MPVSNTLTVQEKAPTNPSLGVCLPVPEDYLDCPFLNLAKLARGFNNNAGASADSQGNLIGISGTGNTVPFVISSQGDDGGNEGVYRGGGYSLLWDGGASCGVTAGTYVTVDGQANPAGTPLTLDFSGNMSFNFTNVDAGDEPTNIRIVKDDEMADFNSGLYLRQKFIDAFLSTPSHLRMLNAMVTTGSDVVDWADYPKLDWQTWSRWPAEVMAEAANRVGCHLWVNVPHQATDAFVTSLITVLDNNLDAGLRIKQEYSNEIWNQAGPFTQSQYCIDQAVAEWGTPDNLSSGINWGMKRFVETMRAAQAVSSRVDGYIGLFAEGDQYHVDYMDAPDWNTNEPGNYDAPHTFATWAGPTHYFGFASSLSTAIRDAFLSEVGTGDFTETKAKARAFWSSEIETTKGYLDTAAADCTGVDTVNGGNRNLKLVTYEGNQHAQINGDPEGVWYEVPPIFDGFQVGDGSTVFVNGRVYRSLSSSGAVGATFPSHTDGSDQTTDGILWRDYTGSEFAANSFALRVGPEANSLRLGDPSVRWGASASVADGDRLVSSAGLVYIVGTTGTTGQTEPTHTTGTQTVDGIDYTSDKPALGDGFFSRDYLRLCDPELMYGYDMVEANYLVIKHILSLGGIATLFEMYGRPSRFGFWGMMESFDDVGSNRRRELWHALMGINAVEGEPV